MRHPFVLCALRVTMGSVFLLAGINKLLQPAENFIYVIQAYAVFPVGLERSLAVSVPWVEYFVGMCLILGLWTRTAIIMAAGFATAFVMLVAQALLRGLELGECGCFGEMISIPLPVILGLDILMVMIALWLWHYRKGTTAISLDQWLTAPKQSRRK